MRTLCGEGSVKAMILFIMTTNNKPGQFPDNEIRPPKFDPYIVEVKNIHRHVKNKNKMKIDLFFLFWLKGVMKSIVAIFG